MDRTIVKSRDRTREVGRKNSKEQSIKMFESQAGFVKPADLFRMRRKKSSGTLNDSSPLASSNNSVPNIVPSSTQQNSSAMSLSSQNIPLQKANPQHVGPVPSHLQQKSPMKSPKKSPHKDAHGSRQLLASTNPITQSASLLTQSPLKCLSNNTIPSPMKKLPTLLRNPFGSNQNSNSSSSSNLFKSPMKTPIKRKLNLDENRSPRKKHRMIELDEDANLEPPKANLDNFNSSLQECEANDWSLRIKLRINFKPNCENFVQDTSSTHKRKKCYVGNIKGKDSICTENDKDTSDSTISVEAIKNVCTVYQHPYMAWMPLFPRITIDFKSSKEVPLNLAKQPQIARCLHKDWCDSLNDLVALLADGLCPYFYMCTDLYNILFRYIDDDTKDKSSRIQAHISPCSYGLKSELQKQGVEFVCSSDNTETSSSLNASIHPILKEMDSFDNPKLIHDSGIATSDDSNDLSDDKEETSQFLESLGLSQHDFPSLTAPVKRKSIDESSKNSVNNIKSLTTIIGYSNVIKMIEFLKGSRLYTMTNVGKFACIPPTLLSPVQFRRSTPQQPEVVLSKHIDESITKSSNVKHKLFHQKDTTSKNTSPSFVEVKGTILPSTYDEIHSLLNTSNNKQHSCISTTLDSTTAYKFL